MTAVDPKAVAAAVARAAAESAHPTVNLGALCDHFVGMCWGLAHSGQVDAASHWAAIPAARKHPGNALDAPAGSLVFFNPDHVAISAGGGKVWSTDILRPGKVDLVTIATITSKWSSFIHGVLGWADPLFPGTADFGSFPVAPTTTAVHAPKGTFGFVDVYGGDNAAQVTKAIIDPAVGAVIVKASEGDTPDTRHDAIVTMVRASKKLVGHYHFPWMSHDPIDSAKTLFIAKAKPLPGDVLVLDFESNGNNDPAQWGTSWPYRVNWLLKFVAAVNQITGAKCWIYMNTDDWGNVLANVPRTQLAQLLSHPLWIADPNHPAGAPNTLGHPWVAQQYGIAGGLDRNVFRGNAAAWKGLGVPAPVVKPPVQIPAPTTTPPTTAGGAGGGNVNVPPIPVPTAGATSVRQRLWAWLLSWLHL